MTEAEWLACTRVPELLPALRGKSSERKLWLFACACCRLVWDRLPEVSRRVVEEVERQAEGENRDEQLVTLLREYYPDHLAVPGIPGGPQAAQAVGLLGERWRWNSGSPAPSPSGVWINEHYWVLDGVARSAAESLAKSVPWEVARQREARLIRDIFAPYSRPSLPVPPSVLAWNGGTVRRIAEGIYAEPAFERLPILADALLDAGCEDEELLGHCRSERPHVRGCWAVDLILGKF